MTARFELSTTARREEAAAWLQRMGYIVVPAYDWSPTSLVVMVHEGGIAEVAMVVRRVDPGATRTR
jgi:hypothetical protein